MKYREQCRISDCEMLPFWCGSGIRSFRSLVYLFDQARQRFLALSHYGLVQIITVLGNAIINELNLSESITEG